MAVLVSGLQYYYIEYKKGREDKAIDALSRRANLEEFNEGVLALITIPTAE